MMGVARKVQLHVALLNVAAMSRQRDRAASLSQLDAVEQTPLDILRQNVLELHALPTRTWLCLHLCLTFVLPPPPPHPGVPGEGPDFPFLREIVGCGQIPARIR